MFIELGKGRNPIGRGCFRENFILGYGTLAKKLFSIRHMDCPIK
jgi:hypothetical protein